MQQFINRFLVSAIALLSSSVVLADEMVLAGNVEKGPDPLGHAPIGVMGDHMHKKGEWMVSYRYMTMDMEDNLQGDESISADEIVRQPNPNAPPPFLRVVPVEMQTEMHMVGLMYAPSDDVTLMAMLNYVSKEMDHITYQGMMGTNQLGTFSTEASGIGDTKVSAMFRLYDSHHHKVHLNFGVSLPTGDIDNRDTVLTPMNMNMEMRLPYAMQLGSGTYDWVPGVTYNGKHDRIAWGAQYMATLRTGSNDEGYSYGDVHKITGWGAYRMADWISGSLRLSWRDQDSIDGMDSQIMAPVQTANPDNYGGQRLDLGVGVNIVGQSGALKGHRLALEYEVPLEQDVNGIQMEMQSMLTLGYQYAF